jgi:hypothetical protein
LRSRVICAWTTEKAGASRGSRCSGTTIPPRESGTGAGRPSTPSATSPASSKAIGERLFPTGLDFLTLQFLAEHAQSDKRIKIIEAEGLRPALDHLVGEVFMEELLAAHAAYGEALGITKAKGGDAKPAPALDEPLRALSQSVVAYALQIVAFAALKAENVEPARQALRPIDEYRAAVSRRANGTSKDQPVDDLLPAGAPAPDSPLPELPTVAES